MSVNERLFVAGLLPSFEDAAKESDRDTLITLLGKVDLGGQAPQIADAVLSRSDPDILGRRSVATIRRNGQGREIWFERWLWSYMPCHWKGWLCLLAAVGAGNAGIWLIIWLLHAKDDGPGPLVVLLLTIGISWVVAERHSPSRT